MERMKLIVWPLQGDAERGAAALEGGREGRVSEDGKERSGGVTQETPPATPQKNMINGLFNARIHCFKTRQDIEGLGRKSQY